jgi:hypothetical protein
MPDRPAGDHEDDRRQYVVLVSDLMASEIDAYGPMSRASAQTFGSRVSLDLDAIGLGSVIITVVALSAPQLARPEGSASSASGNDGEPVA